MWSKCENVAVSLSGHLHACKWPFNNFVFFEHACDTQALYMKCLCLVCKMMAWLVRFRPNGCCRLWLLQNWRFEVIDGDISWCECTNMMYKWWGSQPCAQVWIFMMWPLARVQVTIWHFCRNFVMTWLYEVLASRWCKWFMCWDFGWARRCNFDAADMFRLISLIWPVCFGIFMMALLKQMMYMRWTHNPCT